MVNFSFDNFNLTWIRKLFHCHVVTLQIWILKVSVNYQQSQPYKFLVTYMVAIISPLLICVFMYQLIKVFCALNRQELWILYLLRISSPWSEYIAYYLCHYLSIACQFGVIHYIIKFNDCFHVFSSAKKWRQIYPFLQESYMNVMMKSPLLS